jgi:hypothetical protein
MSLVQSAHGGYKAGNPLALVVKVGFGFFFGGKYFHCKGLPCILIKLTEALKLIFLRHAALYFFTAITVKKFGKGGHLRKKYQKLLAQFVDSSYNNAYICRLKFFDFFKYLILIK